LRPKAPGFSTYRWVTLRAARHIEKRSLLFDSVQGDENNIFLWKDAEKTPFAQASAKKFVYDLAAEFFEKAWKLPEYVDPSDEIAPWVQ
jgi:hypothetical protein